MPRRKHRIPRRAKPPTQTPEQRAALFQAMQSQAETTGRLDLADHIATLTKQRDDALHQLNLRANIDIAITRFQGHVTVLRGIATDLGKLLRSLDRLAKRS